MCEISSCISHVGFKQLLQAVEHEATQSRWRHNAVWMCVCVYCPLGFANVALPPLQQQHGTVSVFVVKLAPCVIVCYSVCTYVCVCGSFAKWAMNNTFFMFEKRRILNRTSCVFRWPQLKSEMMSLCVGCVCVVSLITWFVNWTTDDIGY